MRYAYSHTHTRTHSHIDTHTHSHSYTHTHTHTHISPRYVGSVGTEGRSCIMWLTFHTKTKWIQKGLILKCLCLVNFYLCCILKTYIKKLYKLIIFQQINLMIETRLTYYETCSIWFVAIYFGFCLRNESISTVNYQVDWLIYFRHNTPTYMCVSGCDCRCVCEWFI